MFEAFNRAFIQDMKMVDAEIILSTAIYSDDMLGKLFSLYGGQSFNQGLYRIIDYNNINYWNDLVKTAFPSFSNRITCFSFDWMGRVFAIDSSRIKDSHSGIVMFEPGTAEALEIPCNIETFHESELIHYREEALAENFYHQWLASGGISPRITQCIGYSIPLFLGGSDTTDNLGLSDLDVYWTITSQLIQKIGGLPIG